MKFTHNPVLQNFFVKLILGTIFIIFLPVLVNQLLLEPLIGSFIGDETLNRTIRGFLTAFFLSPVLYYIFFKIFYEEKIQELSLKKLTNGIIWGVIWSVSIIMISLIILMLARTIKDFQYKAPQQLFSTVFLIFILALTEELFFRGIIFRILEGRFSFIIALIASAVLFTFTHIPNSNFNIISIFAVVSGGLLLGILYSYSETLWLPIFFHFFWNLSQAILGLPVSGLEIFANASFCQIKIAGPDWLTGGNFGLENSLVIITLVSLLALYYIIKKWRKKYHSF
ncbi:MAG: CPBP family intramembrane metalloprotease [Spirochaetes bacterium]|nr:CPBP family intramembrane metalloprotease [Spirochaetota bacterium]